MAKKTKSLDIKMGKSIKNAEIGVQEVKVNGRTRILRAAMTAFANSSFEAVSLPEVAREAGLGGPTVHYHFGSKENLWRETIDYAFKNLIMRLEAVENASQDAEPKAGLKMLCRAFAKFTVEYPESVMLLTNENRNPGPRNDWIIGRYLRPFHDYFDSAVERAVLSGAIKKISPIHFTYAVIGATTYFYSILPLTEAMYGDEAKEPKTCETFSDFLINMVFNGVSVET